MSVASSQSNSFINIPNKTVAAVCRIYKIQEHEAAIYKHQNRHQSRLRSSIHGGHNIILSASQEKALLQYIEDSCRAGYPATKRMLFAAITCLRTADQKPPPSMRWFRSYLKQNRIFKTIRTKPISRVRVESHNLKDIKQWHKDLRAVIEEHDIQAENIYNFNKTGIRVGYISGEQVVVPIQSTTVYTASPENRQSISIIETINAAGGTMPPVVIIEAKLHIESWYSETLQGDELILVSDSGYINDDLALRYLRHFILHTKADANSDPKLLLIDSHSTHRSTNFILLADEHRIIPYAFPSHLTHVMQPLDVGVFQPYKHWYKQAVQHALRSLNIEYNIASFMRDLTQIRRNTFKIGTVKNAWKKAGIWPLNYK